MDALPCPCEHAAGPYATIPSGWARRGTDAVQRGVTRCGACWPTRVAGVGFDITRRRTISAAAPALAGSTAPGVGVAHPRKAADEEPAAKVPRS